MDTNTVLITELDQAVALIAAGGKLLRVHYETQDGDRRALRQVPSEWLIERRHAH